MVVHGYKPMIKLVNSKNSRGFTLIELLVVISLMSILTLSSVSVFFSYTKSQTFQTTIADIVAMLNKAKARSLAQVKPTQCGTTSLQGYRIAFVASGADYQLSVLCGGSQYVLETKKLPAQVTFAATSSTSVVFNALSATVAIPASIIVTGFDKTNTISVDSVGNISVQ